MQPGFVSAILPDLDLQQLLLFASRERFGAVEAMCWPLGPADRRYAGVTHIDVHRLDAAAVRSIQDLTASTGVTISGLGYYPNPLSRDPEERQRAVDHLRAVMDAAARLGIGVVNTFIGRDPVRPIEAQWDDVYSIWTPLVRHAADCGLRIGIENCPMLFSLDEWPGGKNLAVSPTVWRRLFELFPEPVLGLNYDPSHMIIQHMDEVQPIREFGDRIWHVHAKDQRIDRARLNDVGTWGLGWYVPKLPGLGDVRWGPLFAALTDIGYEGAVCVEVEDRAYEDTQDKRKLALIQSKRYLDQFGAWS